MSLMQMSLTGSCLIGAIALFRGAFFRRLPKRTLVWLWAAAALVLLIPLRLSAAFSIYGLLPAASATGSQAAAAVPVGVPLWTVVRRVVSVALAVCLAVAYLIGLTRFYQSRIIRDPWAERWLCDHPLRRNLTIRESDRIATPVSGGLLRPVILLPAQRDWDEGTRTCVLAHEFTHIQKLHGLVKLLAAAALCLHWFNPLVWVMAFLLNRDLEFACDEAVLSGETGRADYARALLAAESARWARPLFANGFGVATVKRMEAVARFRRPGMAARIASLAVAAVLIALFTTIPLRSKATAAPSETVPVQAAEQRDERPVEFIWMVSDGMGRSLEILDGKEYYYVPVDAPEGARYQMVPGVKSEAEAIGSVLYQAENNVVVLFSGSADAKP